MRSKNMPGRSDSTYANLDENGKWCQSNWAGVQIIKRSMVSRETEKYARTGLHGIVGFVPISLNPLFSMVLKT